MDKVLEDKPISLESIGPLRVIARPFEDYKRTFVFDPAVLPQNAIILDIGSGTNQEFAQGLKKVRADITVASVDPTLGLPVKDEDFNKLKIKYDIFHSDKHKYFPSTEAEREARVKSALPNTIAALAPDLPFSDNSIDAVFDNHAAYMYFPDNNGLHKEYVRQLLRILKPGGTAYIYPLDLYDDTLMTDEAKLRKSQERIERIMKELGIKQYELFEYDDPGVNPFSGIPARLGIEITK